ncbi:MAG: bifunctional 4-hydroxy-2-oxoglutarate aldolase/2-dehydro-3-deoxy-phosphogluconate aldolase [Spongiibacteraceae bacterium]
MSDIRSTISAVPVIPVLVIERLEHAVPLARALLSGGLSVIEVTLRSAVALEAIQAIRQELGSQLVVGAGTVLNPADLQAALAAGAEFIVSPGATPLLLDAAQEAGAAFLPGVNTPSEVMQLLDRGITTMKFFPAAAAGGVSMLKAMAGPLSEVKFCPTGGVSLQNASDYLALPNVCCVGGSWMAPTELLASEDWSNIADLAAQAARLKR